MRIKCVVYSILTNKLFLDSTLRKGKAETEQQTPSKRTEEKMRYLPKIILLFYFFAFTQAQTRINPFSFDMLIIGGQDSIPFSTPWITAITKKGRDTPYIRHFCGGSLIDPNWVLTAGHCCAFPKDDYEIHIGRHNLNLMTESEGELKLVSRVLKHPNYNNELLTNDVCLLKLDSPSKIIPVKMIHPSQFSLESVKTMALVKGWGNTSNKGISVYPKILQQVEIPIVSFEQCTSKEAYNSGQVTSDMLCAGYKEGGKDSCQGDSGGPFIVKSGKSDILVGVVSWGEGCAEPDRYGVYSRVSASHAWIRNIIAMDARNEL
jgi:secreted trypsin-like serine protease